MSIALVHDFLSQRGGAERVVLQLARVLRDPVIVTSLYAPADTYAEFEEFPVLAARRTSGAPARHFRAQVLAYPGIFRSFDLRPFDLVVISSSAFAHHVVHPRSAVYWHTPPRFLYDPMSYASWAPKKAVSIAANTAPPGGRAARRAGRPDPRAPRSQLPADRRSPPRRLRARRPRAPPAPRHLGFPASPDRSSGPTGPWSSPGSCPTSGSTWPSPPAAGPASRSPSSAPAPSWPGSSGWPTARSPSGRA